MRVSLLMLMLMFLFAVAAVGSGLSLDAAASEPTLTKDGRYLVVKYQQSNSGNVVAQVAATTNPPKKFTAPPVDRFLAKDKQGNYLLWDGDNLKPVKLPAKKLRGCDADSDARFVIVDSFVYFLDGNDLRVYDLTTQKASTVKARLFTKQRPDCFEFAFDTATGKMSLETGLYKDTGAQWPDFVNSKKYSFKVPNAANTRKDPMPKVCTWDPPRTDRAEPVLQEHNGELHLAIRTGDNLVRQRVVDNLEKYRDCMKETDDDNYCSEMKPTFQCKEMTEAGYSLCALGVWQGGADYKYTSVWFDEKTGKTQFSEDESDSEPADRLSPSGCWFFMDGEPVGPGPAPKVLKNLEFIQWL